MKKYHMILVETSNKCNLDCPYCGRSTRGRGYRPSHIEERNMSYDQFDYILTQLSNANIKPSTYLVLHGFGEPLLNPDFPKILKHPLLDVYKARFITNGVLLNKKNIEAIVNSKLARIGFSLQSSSKVVMEALQVNAKFEHVVKNIRELIRYKEKYRRSLKVFVQYLKTKMSPDETKQDFQKLLGTDLNGQWHFKRKMINTHAGQSNSFTFKYLVFPESFRGRWCGYYASDLIINVYGDLCPCCDDTSRVQTYGNIFDTPIEKLIDERTNPRLKMLRKEFANHNYMHLPVCSTCASKE